MTGPSIGAGTGAGAVRPLSPAERDLLAAARLAAVEAAPYLASALFHLTALAADTGTFSVDRWWRLYVDPRQLEAWGPRTAGAVLIHEAHHLLRAHADRADQLGVSTVTQLQSNLAADAEINDDMLGLPGLSLPEGSVTPAAIGCADGQLYEQYYHHLLSHDPPPSGPSGADPGTAERGTQGRVIDTRRDCGSGAGGDQRAWEIGPDDDAVAAVSPMEADLVRRTIAAEMQARQAGRGDVPAGILRWAEGVLAPATVHWRIVLAASLRRACGWKAGQVDYTYRRPGRRRVARVVVPALVAPQPRVAVILDTSGSMGADQLRSALAEVEGLARQVGVRHDELRLICVDASVARPQRWVSAGRIELVGGGGTDLRVGFDAVARLSPRPDVVVVLTDGYTPWPAAPPRVMRTIVVLVPPSAAASTVPTWARTVTVPPGAPAAGARRRRR